MPDIGQKMSKRAKDVQSHAFHDAYNYRHGFVGTEHMLLGLMKIGKSAIVLARFNLSSFVIEDIVQKSCKPAHEIGKGLQLNQIQEAILEEMND
jgi:ATP-dependent Clp protease ATP-binding subunit ClpA